ncbi:MAG: hypothetical protein D6718_01870 [Acidobacteria bacterium]|nr:MAG: hypothetical protein D6718_01870 [Acidobacteriota bacterium]
MPQRNAVFAQIPVAVLLAALGAPASRAVETLPPDALRPGQMGEVRTVLSGRDPQTLAVEILDVLPDEIAPGVPMILCRLADETGRYVGVAAGMSGSPVYVDGKLIGALAYSIGALPREPVCGITPIGAMLESEELPDGPPPAPEGLLPAPLAVAVQGLGAGAGVRFAELWQRLGVDPSRVFVVPSSGGGPPSDGNALAPGRAVSALLVWGDARIAATGTVTWREGDRLLAFGHPFLGFGRTAFALAPAEIAHTVASQLSPFKIARIGDPVGTVTQDRLTGITGRVGPLPPAVRFEAVVERPGRAPVERRYRMVRSPLLTPVLASMLLRQAATATTGDERDEALVMRATVELDGAEPVRYTAAGSGGENGAAEQRLAQELQRLLARLMQAPVALPDVRSVRVQIAAAEPGGGWTLAQAVPDRLAAKPGETIRVHVQLRGPRGAARDETLAVEVPGDAGPGRYTLLVGSARAVDGKLGAVAEARLRTADDARSYLEAVRALRTDAAIAAVLAREGEGIVRGGALYPALPASVHGLVRSRPGGESMYRSRWYPIARAERDVGRSVSGGVETAIEILPLENRR